MFFACMALFHKSFSLHNCLLFVVSSTAVEYTQYKIGVFKTTVLQGLICWFNLIRPVINEVLLKST